MINYQNGIDIQGLQVGGYHPNHTGAEGIKFDFNQAGGIIDIFYNRPTAKEIEQMKSGKIKVGLCQKNGVIFLLFKFGSLNWMDAPYSVHLSKPYELQDIKSGTGYTLNLRFADAGSGSIKVLRLFTMPTDVSREFKKMVDAEKLLSFEKVEYHRKLKQVTSAYETTTLVKIGMTRSA